MTGKLGWILSLLTAGGYEAWAYLTGSQTMSQWIWATSEAHPWFRWLIVSLDGALMWHLLKP